MSEVKVNKISPRTNCGTVQLGDSGDTITIPSGATITNNGTAAGFGSTGEISWDTTKKTATFTAVSGVGYFCDTSGGAITVNLPAGTAGNSFAVADYTNTFQTNNLTISPNGSQKIGGEAEDAVLSTEGQSAYFVYVDDTEGWKNVIDSTSNITGAPPYIVATGGTITTCGNDKIHTFTGPGTFTVCKVSCTAPENVVSYMVVAGGGGQTNPGHYNGGGGAGGFREVKAPDTPYTASPLDGYPSAPNRITVTATAFPITVGGGGSGGPGPSGCGSNSVFSTITSTGGGLGAGGNPNPPGGPGGSAGGGGGNAPTRLGGTGNTPSVSPPQGNDGGDGNPDNSGGGGGGGGATVAGGDANPASRAGAGGAGATTSISASPTTYSGGGGGGSSGGTGGLAGPGGGGAGAPGGGVGSNGTTNTGGGAGGGGSSYGNGGTGGSGIVIIRYKFQ